MLDKFIAFIGSYFASFGYLIVFLAVTLENSIFLGLVVPGETLVILGGFYAAQGVLNLYLVMIVSFVGCVLGGQLGYLFGREGRKRVFKRYENFFQANSKVKMAEGFLKTHGAKTVFASRFTAFLRAVAPFVAGTLRMPYLKFTFWDVLGAAAWSVVIPLLGYFFGQYWRQIHHYLGDFGVILLAIVIIIVWINLRKKRSKNEHD